MNSLTNNEYPQIYQRYILLDPIGSGGMGQVFRAVTMDEINRVVVVKKTFEHFRSNSSYVKMFRDEIKILSLLNHPNIVHLYNYGPKAEFLEMEYVRGLSLNQILMSLDEKKEKIPIEIAVYIAHEAAKGLSYAHELRDDAKSLPLGIVHRDISPHNLMVTAKGSVKILDFGISKFSDQLNVTEFGVVKGKRHYIAPEQNRGESVNASADIYSLGAVLWRMLVGQPPFDADNKVEYNKLVVESEIKAPSEYNPQVTKSLDLLCKKALQFRPENRLKNMEEFQVELLQISKEINRENSIVRKTSDWIHSNFKNHLLAEEESLRVGLTTASLLAKNIRENQDQTQIIPPESKEIVQQKSIPNETNSVPISQLISQLNSLLNSQLNRKVFFTLFMILIVTAAVIVSKFSLEKNDSNAINTPEPQFISKNQTNLSPTRNANNEAENKKDTKVSLSDLQLLAEQGFYAEVMPNLTQIPVTERLESWRELVIRTCLGWLEKKSEQDNNSAFESTKDLELKFPFILENDAYSEMRLKIAMAWFDQCSQTDSDCLKVLLPFVKADNKNADIAFKIARKATYFYYHYYALPFFKIALERKNNKSYCKDERLKSAIEVGQTFSTDSQFRILADELTIFCKK